MSFQAELDLIPEGGQGAVLYGIHMIGAADMQTDRVRVELL